MASSGGGAEMLDAPVRELEKLAVSYDEALKRVGLDGDARLKSGIDLGSKFSTINYGRRTDPDYRHVHSEDPDDTKNKFCELVFGAKTQEDHAPGHKVLAMVEYFKLSLVSPAAEVPQDHQLLEMVLNLQRKIVGQVNSVRKSVPDGKYCVRDPLTAHNNVHTLLSIRCVLREFLRFLWRSAQHHYAEAYGLRPDLVTRIFKEKADVMIAVPTGSIWENEAKDELRMLLHEAGFPKNTFIWSEPNASAMYDLLETAERQGVGIAEVSNTVEVRMVNDVGGLTTDFCGLGASHVYNSCAVTLKEVVPGMGSFNGSQRLNELFREHLKGQFPRGLLQLTSGFDGTEDDLLEAFERGFEKTKQSFDGARQGYKVKPVFKCRQKPRFKDIKLPTLVITENQMILAASPMKKIFDDWLYPIQTMLEGCMSEIDSPCTIALTGGGSRPAYVLGYLKQQLERTSDAVPANEQVAVEMMASEIDSAVARGNFVYLSSLNVNEVQQARADFGIVGQEPFVTQDADLSGAIKYETTGVFRVTEPKFPLVHTLSVMSCLEMGSPDAAGDIEVRVPNIEKGGWELKQEDPANQELPPKTYVDIPYRLELLLEELMPKLKINILTRTGGRLGDNMTWIIPLKTLCKHLTNAEDFKKKTEDSSDDDVEFECEPARSEPTRSEPTAQYTGVVSAWLAEENFGREDDDMMDTS